MQTTAEDILQILEKYPPILVKYFKGFFPTPDLRRQIELAYADKFPQYEILLIEGAGEDKTEVLSLMPEALTILKSCSDEKE